MRLPCAAYLRDVLEIPDCQIALRVDRMVTKSCGEVVSHEVRYFITDPDPEQATAHELLQYVRGHWRVESFHFIKDCWWSED